MPKKKTGARKKAEKQKERQRGIREGRDRPISEYFCNVIMVGLCPSCCGLKLFYYWDTNYLLLYFHLLTNQQECDKCKR